MSSLPPIVKVAVIKRYTRDELISIRSFIQCTDLKLINKLRNHQISFHLPHHHRSIRGLKQHNFLQSTEKVLHLKPHSVQPSSNHSLALDMVQRYTPTYLCTSYSSKCTCLYDCHLHDTIKKRCTLVINFQSIHNKINKIKVLLDSINPDVIIGTKSWLNYKTYSAENLPNTNNVFSRDREDSYRGVLIALKSELQCSLVNKSITSELLSIKLRHQIRLQI